LEKFGEIGGVKGIDKKEEIESCRDKSTIIMGDYSVALRIRH